MLTLAVAMALFHSIIKLQHTASAQGIFSLTVLRPAHGNLLSSLVTNGMARVGINSYLQGSLKLSPEREPDDNQWYSGKGDVFDVDPDQSKDWVKLRVNSALKGYAYNCNGIPPKVAVAIHVNVLCYGC